MYKQIVNPATGRKVNVNGKLGQKVLNNYYNQIGGDGKWYEIGNPFCGKGCVLFDESANKPVELGNNLKIVSRAKAKQMQLKAQEQSPLPNTPPLQPLSQAQADAQARAQAEAQARAQAEAQAKAQAEAQARAQAQEAERVILEKCTNCAKTNCKRYLNPRETRANIDGLAQLIHRGINKLITNRNMSERPDLCGRNLAIFHDKYNIANAGGIIEGFMQIMKNINACRIDAELRNSLTELNSEIITFCEKSHPVGQQGGKRKNNSKNNTKKRNPSRKNNRKRRASKNKRN